MGLLSVTDAILHMPMKDVLSHLPLSADVYTALCGGANRSRDVFETLLSYERADWKRLSWLAAKIGCPEDRQPESHFSAANRASAVSMQSTAPNKWRSGILRCAGWMVLVLSELSWVKRLSGMVFREPPHAAASSSAAAM